MQRFEFGKNWTEFSETISEEKIHAATESLKKMLSVETLSGRTFLDIGCGSGLFSLAACRLGAKRVESFDYDEDSVACATSLRSRYGVNYAWSIARGDILDIDSLHKMGFFDVVYSWGVLHHTGSMWQALANAATAVKSDGLLFVSIYNDQGMISKVWHAVKYFYNGSPRILKLLLCMVWFCVVILNRLLQGLLEKKPLSEWFVGSERGMNIWYDVVDWVGGYPFETATPAQLISFFEARGFIAVNERLKSGSGCNEIVFRKNNSAVSS